MPKFWKTSDGKKIKIKDLDDKHLINCIHYLEKTSLQEYSRLCSIGSIFIGDGACNELDDIMSGLEEDGDDPAFLYPIYNDLIKEAEKRNLKYV